jgi:biopolymer transport protein ExbB
MESMAKTRGATALLGSVAWLTLVKATAAQSADNAAPPVVASASLPRDLSPWGMFVSADIVVKAVIVGLAFASLVTWTIWLAKTIEILVAKRRARAALRILEKARNLAEVP